jgi:hypothetical protein
MVLSHPRSLSQRWLLERGNGVMYGVIFHAVRLFPGHLSAGWRSLRYSTEKSLTANHALHTDRRNAACFGALAALGGW